MTLVQVVKMMGHLWFDAEEEKGEAVTHFLGALGQRGTAQSAVVMRPKNGNGGYPRQREEDDSQVGQIGPQG
jgi:hypothetical protein